MLADVVLCVVGVARCSVCADRRGVACCQGCQVSGDYTQAYPIGTQDSAQFSTDPTTGDLNLKYSATDGTGGVR